MTWLVGILGTVFGALTGAIAAAFYKAPWKLEGSDCFDCNYYRLIGPYGYAFWPRRHPWPPRESPRGQRRRVFLIGVYGYQAQAENAARKWLEYLDSVQAPDVSGGQYIGGTQDHVWIIHPNGERLRYLGSPD